MEVTPRITGITGRGGLMMDDDYRDRAEREYWEQYNYEHSDHSSGGPKSAVPFVIYLILILATAPIGGSLPIMIFGAVPMYVYYRCM